MLRKLKNSLCARLQWRIYAIHPKPHLRAMMEYFGDKEIDGLEIGTGWGYTAKSYFWRLNIRRLDTIDPYLSYGERMDHQKNRQEMEIRLGELIQKGHVHFHQQDSDSFFSGNVQLYDFVYIDGDHSYEQVRKDIANSWKYLRPGGILAGDDFPTYDVARAVIEFAEKEGVKVNTYDLDWWVMG